MSRVIQLEAVCFSYGGPPALENISLSVDSGTFLGLVGPNAGGKSTLLKIILGLLTPQTGRVSVLGQSPVTARRSVGYVPQFTSFRRDFPISVESTILMGRLGKAPLLGGYRAGDRRIVREIMQETEIAPLARRSIGKLSGGQLQRVLLARALAAEPAILILDEPTSNVDMRAETDIFDLLKQLNSRMTILVVSHDIAFVSQYVSQVACLNRTLLCHNTAAVSGEIIQQLYGESVRMVDHHSHAHAGGPHD